MRAAQGRSLVASGPSGAVLVPCCRPERCRTVVVGGDPQVKMALRVDCSLAAQRMVAAQANYTSEVLLH